MAVVVMAVMMVPVVVVMAVMMVLVVVVMMVMTVMVLATGVCRGCGAQREARTGSHDEEAVTQRFRQVQHEMHS
jgi:hypothetical protein